MTDRELFEQALEAMEHLHRTGDTQVFDLCYAPELIPALRERLAQPEPKADAHLFYAPGDVLICKESDERVVVKNGNTGPMQLANGKISLEWSDEVYGEYTLEQIMDGFKREGYAPRLKQPEQEPVAWMYINLEGECEQIEYLENEPLPADPSITPLYTGPQRREWVGLTYDEIKAAYCAVSETEWALGGMKDANPFARAIEAKLREKNI